MGCDGVCSADNILWVVFDSFWVTLCLSPLEQLIPYASSTNTSWAFLRCRVPSWPQKTGCLRLNGKGFPLSWVLFLNKQNAWWVLFSRVRLALRGRCNIWRSRKQLTMNGRCNRHSPVPPWSLNSVGFAAVPVCRGELGLAGIHRLTIQKKPDQRQRSERACPATELSVFLSFSLPSACCPRPRRHNSRFTNGQVLDMKREWWWCGQNPKWFGHLALWPKPEGYILEETNVKALNLGLKPYLPRGWAETGFAAIQVKMACKCYLPEKQMRALSGAQLQVRGEQSSPMGTEAALCSGRAGPPEQARKGGAPETWEGPWEPLRWSRPCRHVSCERQNVLVLQFICQSCGSGF